MVSWRWIKINMDRAKKYRKVVFVSMTAVLAVFVLSGCDNPDNSSQLQNKNQGSQVQSINQQANDITTQPNSVNANSGKSSLDNQIKCSQLKPAIEQEMTQESNATKLNVTLDRIFYSPQYDSCLYAYIIEDDNSEKQCTLNAQMIHYDMFVVKDYLNNKVILRKTKGCSNFYGNNFDDFIDKLEAK